MTTKTCDNADCYNFDRDNMIFCDGCLDEVLDKLTIDDLYDIYCSVDQRLNECIIDGENHDLLTKQGKKSIIKTKKKWFKIMNDLMNKKARRSK